MANKKWAGSIMQKDHNFLGYLGQGTVGCVAV